MAEQLAQLIQGVKLHDLEEFLKGDGSKLVNQAFPSTGEFPVHAAAKCRSPRLMELLLDSGANPNQGSEEQGSTRGYTPAHYAARLDDVDMLLALAKHGADFNRQATDGWAPIHCAAFGGKRLALLTLLDHGADLNTATQHGVTALVFSVNHGRATDVRDMVRRGASLKVCDGQGDTLMHHCLHYEMSKLFEGDYNVPECQLDVAVLLATSGAPIDGKNNEGKDAFVFMQESLPSLKSVLLCLAHNGARFTASKTEWNYMTLLAAGVEHFLGIGLEMKHAVDLYEMMQKLEKERLAEKKRVEEETPQGGCPVMRGRRKRGEADAAAKGATEAKTQTPEEIRAAGGDPSGGKCPFFQKPAATASAPATTNAEDSKGTGSSKGPAEVTLPPTHPPLPAGVKADPNGPDPSGGKCPFFRKKAETLEAHNQPKGAAARNELMAVTQDAILRFLYNHMTALLFMLISFLLGIVFEQRFGRTNTKIIS